MCRTSTRSTRSCSTGRSSVRPLTAVGIAVERRGGAESHILTASPYFAGQFVTVNGKSCEIEEASSQLVCGDGCVR